ncbi:MAG: sigma-54-dependent Fis family transcriptional regulator [Chitinophagaceae bacterium]|nr:MAG: sigma-54-dependent Fis family transcriptional regulator [Chitinophagaceae bacterium]
METEMNNTQVMIPGFVEQVNTIAANDLPVILAGPKDSGREWIAELIHDLSERNERPFLIINCITSAAYPALVELSQPIRREFAELQKLADEGLLESIRGGTVWLNNFSELPFEEQEQFLPRISDVLQCRIITGLSKTGGTRSPHEQLAVIPEKNTLAIPPLRHNKKTIQFFLNYFLAKTNLEWNREVPGFSEEAMEILGNYAWPGNLYELRELVRDAVFLGENGVPVAPRLLPAAVRSYQSHDPLFLKKAVLKAEYDLICKTLYETRNNKRKAAEILKISRKTLYSKMRIFQDSNSYQSENQDSMA